MSSIKQDDDHFLDTGKVICEECAAKWPPRYVLIALAKMLKDAKYPNVAEHLAAGFLWSVYPEWFDGEKCND